MNSSYILTEVMETKNIINKISLVLFAGFKFICDRLLAIIGLIVASPIMLIIAIAIKLDSKGSILFKQERTGKDGQNFYIYKFRTMAQSNDVHDFSKQDKHTRVGKILRKTSLDEFPQFINVFLGQMSLVGNRPYLPREKEDMGEYYDEIIKTKPGITGLWQTSGRSNTTFDERLQIERRYSRIHNMKLDIEIFFKTIVQVIKKDGAN